jgi:hypothetical protein
MSTLEEFIGSDEPFIALTAKQLQHYKEELEVGEISKSEFNELCNDLLCLDHINLAANNAEDQIMLKQAFNAMVAIASAASGI